MRLRRPALALGLIVLVAALPLFAAPGSPGAIVTPTAGSVAINGQTASAGWALLPGDVIATGAHSSARLVLPGASLLAAANTRLQMEGARGAAQIRLRSGLVEISGNLPVAVASRLVTPASERSRFNVYDLSGEVYVTAVTGAVAVRSATGTYAVPAGKTVKFRDPQALPVPVAMKAPGVPLLTVAGEALAAAAASGAIVYFATHCKHCVVSPSSL